MNYENDVFRFVESISPYVQQTAKQLGVPPGSIIGPIAHEYNLRISNLFPGVIDQWAADLFVDMVLDHAQIVSEVDK